MSVIMGNQTGANIVYGSYWFSDFELVTSRLYHNHIILREAVSL